VLVEQNAHMALQVAHYDYVMENGKIMIEGAAKDLAENPDVKEFYWAWRQRELLNRIKTLRRIGVVNAGYSALLFSAANFVGCVVIL
jgi:hypothetical protein